MSDNSCYWKNRKERKAKAAAWVNKMDAEYRQEIIESEKGTELYDEGSYPPKWYTPETKRIPKVTLLDCDTVSAIFTVEGDVKLAVLNFASFKNPGGAFLDGSSAQEECLCHESFLYNVLQHHDDVYYSVNRRMLNKGQYCNRALYTPDIAFFHNGKSRKCNVITCAAPNYSVGLKYNLVTKEENSVALRSRIRFVFDIAAANKVDTFILGAFGCGVFSQDAAEVAGIMVDLLPNYCFENIVFAIPDKNSKNYQAFENAFQNWNEKLGQTKEINAPECDRCISGRNYSS